MSSLEAADLRKSEKSDLVLQVAKTLKPASFITRCQVENRCRHESLMSLEVVYLIVMISQCPAQLSSHLLAL